MPTVATPPATEVEPRRFTSDEVQAMLQAGILHEDDRFELISGQLIPMAPIGNTHVACVNQLNYLLSKVLVEAGIEDVRVSVQNPVRIDAYNEPEPDLVLSSALDRAPEPDDVLLLVEVTDTTLAYDRETKLPLYAQAGLPEVWIVNLSDGQVEVHRDPSEDLYRTRQIAVRGDTITVQARPDIEGLPVREILPKEAREEDNK